MGIFRKVIYDPEQAEIAKVNRLDKTLYINSDIWKGLPAEQKKYVLLHEEGHLELKTADEFEANKYAVRNFVPVRTLTNAQLGQKIVVMRNILTPQTNSFTPDIIAGALSSITNVLPVLGVGSKSRIAEAGAQSQILAAQSKADAKKANTYIIMGVLAGVLLIVGGTLYFTLKK